MRVSQLCHDRGVRSASAKVEWVRQLASRLAARETEKEQSRGQVAMVRGRGARLEERKCWSSCREGEGARRHGVALTDLAGA
mmetsp:Transcript_9915/g.15677  ORF Transcript_9915/g.15677 Transcript_9915/m.15677 type:complete len:82 (+) Transcript_9915:500-745(+)